jgi:S-formylglutathione hydrolase FrmB
VAGVPARTPRVGVVLALLTLAATTLIIEGRADAAQRGYSSTYGATVVTYSLASDLLGRRLNETAIVPPGNERRPLLVLLHGRHDGPSAPPSKSGPQSMLSNALFAGLAELGERAPIVVLLNGGRHTWYHDRRYGRWGSMILDEAIPDAVRRFHARAEPIAIGGISMGGYGALHLAALRPHEFCAVGAHSAALYKTAGASPAVAFDDAADFARNNVYNAARRGRFNRLPVWIDGGSNDPFRNSDAAFAAVLRARSVDVTYHVWPGAHTASYWEAHMAEYLAFYASALARCSSELRALAVTP